MVSGFLFGIWKGHGAAWGHVARKDPTCQPCVWIGWVESSCLEDFDPAHIYGTVVTVPSNVKFIQFQRRPYVFCEISQNLHRVEIEFF